MLTKLLKYPSRALFIALKIMINFFVAIAAVTSSSNVIKTCSGKEAGQ